MNYEKKLRLLRQRLEDIGCKTESTEMGFAEGDEKGFWSKFRVYSLDNKKAVEIGYYYAYNHEPGTNGDNDVRMNEDGNKAIERSEKELEKLLGKHAPRLDKERPGILGKLETHADDGWVYVTQIEGDKNSVKLSSKDSDGLELVYIMPRNEWLGMITVTSSKPSKLGSGLLAIENTRMTIEEFLSLSRNEYSFARI